MNTTMVFITFLPAWRHPNTGNAAGARAQMPFRRPPPVAAAAPVCSEGVCCCAASSGEVAGERRAFGFHTRAALNRK
eukprot:5469031-Alexandrium_andersonii.AAC.1